MVSPPTVPRLFHDETVLLPAFSPPRRRDDDDDDDGPDHGFHRKLPPGLIPRVDADVGNPPVGGVRMSHRQTHRQTHRHTDTHTRTQFVGRTSTTKNKGGTGFETSGMGPPPGCIVRLIFQRCQKSRVSTMESCLTKPILNPETDFKHETEHARRFARFLVLTKHFWRFSRIPASGCPGVRVSVSSVRLGRARNKRTRRGVFHASRSSRARTCKQRRESGKPTESREHTRAF